MPSYRDAGVDIEGAERHVARIARDVTSTWTSEVVGAFGGFAAGIEVPDSYRRPVLMMTTDGVGTKLDLARAGGMWDGVGFDLVAMCVDDLVVTGARPLAFVDYMAVGSLEPDRDARIVRSIAQACAAADCSLLGGETAEHPGTMPRDAVDLAGAAVGVVEKGRELGPHLVTAGDVVIGLRSPNVRSNGFSLIREVFGDELEHHASKLLEPSVVYAPSVMAAIGSGGVHAAAHITGGGLAHNLARSLPDAVGVSIDRSAWDVPGIFTTIYERGVTEDEMWATFNMGIGMCLIVDPAEAETVLGGTVEHSPVIVGRVEQGSGVELS